MTAETADFPLRRLRYPIHPVVAHFAAACFLGALLTDLAYWRTAEMMWADFSAWLVTVGVILGAVALVLALFDIFSGRLRGLGGAGRLQLLVYLVALIVSVFNAMIHTRDAWTSVVPWGLTLSAVVAVLLVIAGMLGWTEQSRSRLEVGG